MLNHQGGPDSNGGGKMDGNGGTTDGQGANGCINAGTVTPPAGQLLATYPDGHHNAGQACIVAGCHLNANPGAGATGWMFAGTLYAGDGTTPVAGGVVEITSGATTLQLVTATNGNFWVAANPPPSVQLNQSPNTKATACPNLQSMTAALTAPAGGNCNSCHSRNSASSPMLPIEL